MQWNAEKFSTKRRDNRGEDETPRRQARQAITQISPCHFGCLLRCFAFPAVILSSLTVPKPPTVILSAAKNLLSLRKPSLTAQRSTVPVRFFVTAFLRMTEQGSCTDSMLRLAALVPHDRCRKVAIALCRYAYHHYADFSLSLWVLASLFRFSRRHSEFPHRSQASRCHPERSEGSFPESHLTAIFSPENRLK